MRKLKKMKNERDVFFCFWIHVVENLKQRAMQGDQKEDILQNDFVYKYNVAHLIKFTDEFLKDYVNPKNQPSPEIIDKFYNAYLTKCKESASELQNKLAVFIKKFKNKEEDSFYG